MSISEQIKELRKLANSKEFEPHEPVTYGFYARIKSKLFKAADTIEALSAKLAAATPIRPLEYEEHEDYDEGICPICGEPVCHVYAYCPGCGQDLKWGSGTEKSEVVNIEQSVEDCSGWIYCGDGKNLPEEYDSMFAKLKGTEKWDSAMFEKISDDVNVTVEFENGERKTKTLHTVDGKWNGGQRGVKFKVIAWQPLPEPYRQ